MHVACDDWTPSINRYLLAKYNSTGNFSYRLLLDTTGELIMSWSPDGTTVININSTATVPFSDYESGWIRATLDVDNGASGNNVKFYTSSDGTTWNQLGSTVTTAGTTSIYAGSNGVVIGARSNTVSDLLAMKVYRVKLFDGIEDAGGTKILDIDTSVITSGSAETFADLTGNHTVQISRYTAGKKSVAVVSPVWLFGTDDYIEVADNALLDFDAADSFTIIAIHRPWATQGTNDTLIAKKANTTNTTAGYNLSGGSSTALQGQAQIGDGTAGITAVSGNRTSGELTITAAVRNVATDDLIVYLNGTAGTAVTDTTTAAINSTDVFRIGRLSGAGTEYADMELLGVAVFRRALASADISSLTTFYQNRLS
jgi:hypothetical protein